MKCPHLEKAELAKHSELVFRTVHPDQNTTDYVWELDWELCVYCSGLVRGVLSKMESGWKR